MLNIMVDGLSVLYLYKEGVLFFFATTLGYGFLTIKYATDHEMDARLKWLAALGVGSIVLCVISCAVVLLGYFWPSLLRPASFVILFFGIFILLKGFWSGELKMAFDTRLVIGCICLFLLLLVRLSFLKHIILPPYSDSAVHYQIVLGFLHPDETINSKISLGNVFNNYYHFGFHSLASWLVSITEFAPADVISLLGQLFLVIAPISVFLLAYVITKRAEGALFAGLLAAIGWLMPAFAVNWGKFPAVASLALTPAALALLLLGSRSVVKKTILLLCGLVLLMGLTLIHTRIIVCVLLAVISFFLSNKLRIEDKLGFAQSIRLSLFYVLSLWPLSQLLVDFYKSLVMLIILLCLLPFAFQTYPRLSMGIFFYTFGLWLIVLAPTLLNENARTLLDRQFLEIMLYIPFSVIGGAGFAGWMEKLPPTGILRSLTVLIFAGGVIFNFLQTNSVYPDPCCDYFKEGDQLAFQWIRENSPEHTLVIISAFNDNGKIVGTDSGIWIYPLLAQSTNKLLFNTNWDSLDTIEEICYFGAKQTYIYMGGRQYSFANAQLSQEKWITLVFKAGETVIYQVSGCPNKPQL